MPRKLGLKYIGGVVAAPSPTITGAFMSVIRLGSTKQFAEGWDKVFGGEGKPSKKSSKTAKKKTAKKAATKKAAKKKTTKKKAAKKKSGRK